MRLNQGTYFEFSNSSISNGLGNVRAVISDRKFTTGSENYLDELLSATDSSGNNNVILVNMERLIQRKNRYWKIFFLIILLNSCCNTQKDNVAQNNFQITEIVLSKSYMGISPHWYFGIRIKSYAAISLNDNIQINIFGVKDESNQRWKIVSDSSIVISTPMLTNNPEKLLNKILHYPLFVRIICNGKMKFLTYDKLTSIKIIKKYNDDSDIKTIRNPLEGPFVDESIK